MDTNLVVGNAEGELKSERVESALTIEPLRIQLKSEQVKEALPDSGEVEVKTTTIWEVAFNQPQPVTIELVEPQVILYLYGLSTEAAQAA